MDLKPSFSWVLWSLRTIDDAGLRPGVPVPGSGVDPRSGDGTSLGRSLPAGRNVLPHIYHVP
ncbi:hypothetical protein GCM10022252_11960 [Streptosporangium oxazolinicum]|uniref:Uncharacterized protein n=1 Tax=Streptosporangium oxazolinicum TaxID=909287 RepID=A0ABP8AH63_9ACTN